MNPHLILIMILAGGLLFVQFFTPRIGKGSGPLIFLFYYLAFSGFLTNIYERASLIHASRYLLVIAVALYYHSRLPVNFLELQREPITRALMAFIGVYSLEMFNPDWSSIMVGILNGLVGHAQHTLPMVTLFVAYLLFRRPIQYYRILAAILALTTIMALYGLYQSYQGYAYIAGLGKVFQENLDREHTWILDQGQGVMTRSIRPMSFAQDAGAASRYYAIGCVVAVAFILYPTRNYYVPLAAILCLMAQITALLLTLVRSSFVGACVGGIAIVFSLRRAKAVMLVAVVLLTYGLSTQFAGGFIEHRFSGLLSTETYVKNRGLQWEAMFWVIKRFPTGAGIGRVGPGSHRFSAPEDMLHTIPEENYFVCLFYETGIFGGVCMIWIFVLVTVLCKDALLKFRHPEVRGVAIPIAAMLLGIELTSLSGPTLYTVPVNYSFWLGVGSLLRLRETDRELNYGLLRSVK